MAKINFVGIIEEKDIKKYQDGKLDKNAVEIKTPKNIQLSAIPFLIPNIFILFLSMYLKASSAEFRIIDPIFIVLGVFIGFLFLFVHEYLHAIVYPKGVDTYIGFVPPITFVALGSYPMKKSRFILMCVLPYILGIVPLLAFISLPANYIKMNSILFGVAVMGMSSIYPDLYNVYLVITKVPKNKRIQFQKNEMYYI